jgi:hypothetical protein
MPALDQRIEIDLGDCYFEIKEVIPTAGSAKTRVGGSANAAGDAWDLDTSNRFEVYPVERFVFQPRSRISTHHNISSFLSSLAHGPKTIDGSFTIRLKVGAKLLMAVLGSDKAGSTNPTKSYGNMVGDGTGHYDGGDVTNLNKQNPVFALKVTWMKESMSAGNPITCYIKNVLLADGGTGFNPDGAETISVSFQATFLRFVYNKDGY